MVTVLDSDMVALEDSVVTEVALEDLVVTEVALGEAMEDFLKEDLVNGVNGEVTEEVLVVDSAALEDTAVLVALEVMAAVSEVLEVEALVATVVSYIKICSIKNDISYIFCASDQL